MVHGRDESAGRLAQVRRVQGVSMHAEPERAFVLAQDLIHFAKRFGGHFDVQLRFYDPGEIFRQQCLVVVFAPGLCRGRAAAAAGGVLFALIVCEQKFG